MIGEVLVVPGVPQRETRDVAPGPQDEEQKVKKLTGVVQHKPMAHFQVRVWKLLL